MYSSQSIRHGVGLDDLLQAGEHACHFYHSADDLGEVLVPYFKAGLERNERCLWVTANPYGKVGPSTRCEWLCPISTAGPLLAKYKYWVKTNGTPRLDS